MKELESMIEFMKDKRNSYDGHIQEKAYWNCLDCITILKTIQDETIANTVVTMFNRFKWFV